MTRYPDRENDPSRDTLPGKAVGGCFFTDTICEKGMTKLKTGSGLGVSNRRERGGELLDGADGFE